MSFHGADLVGESRRRWPSSTPCAQCGATPTADVEFVEKRGSHATTIEGPFCHDCGLAVFRSATATTLSRGWWAPFSFFTPPLIVGVNVLQRRHVARLGPPRMPTEGRSPIPLGRSLWLRWQIVGVLIPIVAVAAVVGAVEATIIHTRHKEISYLGRCVQGSIPAGAFVGTATIVDCAEPHNGRIMSEFNRFDGGCPAEDTVVTVPGAGTRDFSYCVEPTG